MERVIISYYIIIIIVVYSMSNSSSYYLYVYIIIYVYLNNALYIYLDNFLKRHVRTIDCWKFFQQYFLLSRHPVYCIIRDGGGDRLASTSQRRAVITPLRLSKQTWQKHALQPDRYIITHPPNVNIISTWRVTSATDIATRKARLRAQSVYIYNNNILL